MKGAVGVRRRLYRNVFLKHQEAKVESAAWKNYFYGKQETNDIMNEISRMEGIIGDMVRPVRGDYLEKLKARKDLKKDLFDANKPPPPRM